MSVTPNISLQRTAIRRLAAAELGSLAVSWEAVG